MTTSLNLILIFVLLFNALVPAFENTTNGTASSSQGFDGWVKSVLNWVSSDRVAHQRKEFSRPSPMKLEPNKNIYERWEEAFKLLDLLPMIQFSESLPILENLGLITRYEILPSQPTLAVPSGLATFDPGEWTVVGSAYSDPIDGRYILTDAPGETGAVWKNEKIDLNQKFDKSFVVYLGDEDLEGGEGLAFVFQTFGLDAIGEPNKGIGYYGISQSLAIELDSFYNNLLIDPTHEDHIAVVEGESGCIRLSQGLENFEDNQPHILRISWRPGSKNPSHVPGANHLYVYFDHALVLDFETNYVYIDFGSTDVYYGFTGATSEATNLQYFYEYEPIIPDEMGDCNNLDCSLSNAPSASTVTVGNGINARNGDFQFSNPDLSFRTSAGDLSFQRIYSSLRSDQNPVGMGYGWTSNHHSRLIFPSDQGGEQGKVLFVGRTHNVYSFTETVNGEYLPEPGLNVSMTKKTDSGTYYEITDPDKNIMIFSDTGRLERTVDAQGHVIQYTYDTDGRLSRISADVNDQGNATRYLELSYESGLLKSISDHANRSVTYTYDDGELIQYKDVREKNWYFHYTDDSETDNQEHFLHEILDPLQERVLSINFVDGRVSQQYGRDEKLIVELTYNDGATSVINGLGNTWNYTFDEQNVRSGSDGPLSAPAAEAYDDNYRLDSISEPSGNETRLFWGSGGKNLERVVERVMDTQDYTTLFEYDLNNNIIQIQDARQVIEDGRTIYLTKYLYEDARFPKLPTKVIEKYVDQVTQYSYNESGFLEKIIEPGGRATTFTHNLQGQILSESVAVDATHSLTTYYTYDSLGRMKTQKDPNGKVRWFCYDPAGNITRTVENASGDGSKPQSNPCDTVNYQVSGIPGEDLISSNLYDDLGRLYASSDSAGRITRTYFDPNSGRISTVVRNLFDYQVENSEPPERNPSLSDRNIRTDMIYDDAGNVIATIDPMGIITRTYYDVENRPVDVVQNWVSPAPEIDIYSSSIPAYDPTHPDQNIRTTTTYDQNGNVIATTDANQVVTRTYYDSRNRPKNVVVNLTGNIYSENPPDSNPLKPDQNVRTEYYYDQNSNLIAEKKPTNNVWRTYFDKDGNLTVEKKASNNITRTYYDELNRPYLVVENWAAGPDPRNEYPPDYDLNYPDQNLHTDYYYDVSGNQIAVEKPDGRITRTFYDGINRPTAVVQNIQIPNGKKVSDVEIPNYDPNNPDINVVTKTVYDDQGKVIATIDPDGTVTRTYYDQNDRQQYVVQNLPIELIYNDTPPAFDPENPDQNVRTEYVYDAQGRLIDVIRNDNKITRTVYDLLDRPILTIQNFTGTGVYDPAHPDQNIRTETNYDAAGRVVKTVDPLDVASYSCYDGLGRIEKTVVNPTVDTPCEDYVPSNAEDEDVTTLYSYDAVGNRLSSTDPNEIVTTYTYDKMSRLTKEINQSSSYSTTYTYDIWGNQVSKADAENFVTAYGYSVFGQLTTVTENYKANSSDDKETNVRTLYYYDLYGNLRTRRNGRKLATHFTYDMLGRIKSETDLPEIITYYKYDHDGNLRELTDAKGFITHYEYDDLGRLTYIDYPDPDADVVFTYDAAGNRKTMMDGNGTTSWEYDGLNRPKKVTDPISEVRYEYDAVGNRTALVYPDQKRVIYTYNDTGSLSQVTDWNSQSTYYSYDKGGRPSSVQLPNGIRSSYTFNNSNRLTSISHTLGTETLSSYIYAYDKVGNRTQVIESILLEGDESSPTYLPVVCKGCGEEIVLNTDLNAYPAPRADGSDPFAPESEGTVSGSEDAYPAPEQAPTPDTTTGIWDQIVQFFQALFRTPTVSAAAPVSASFDGAMGLSSPTFINGKSVTPSLHTGMEARIATVQIDYQYDPLGRLKSAIYSNGTSFNYTYDAVGNRETETVNGGVTTTYTYDNANRLTNVSGVNYMWDKNGNLLSDGENTYTYDRANRLVSVTRPGMTASYQYNGLGDRVRETNNGVTSNFTLDLNSGLTQVLADGTKTYLYGAGRIGQFTAADSAYFLGDALGSVRQLVDGTGSITMSKSYEPYGGVLSVVGSGDSEYGYTGEWTTDNNHVYLRSRFYVPGMGRFLTRDSWQGQNTSPMSYNLWLYVYSNPINAVDPTGMIPNWDGDETYNEKFAPIGISFTPAINPLSRGAGGLITGKEGAQYIGNNTGLCGLVSVSAIIRAFDGRVIAREVVKEFSEVTIVKGKNADPNYLSIDALQTFIKTSSYFKRVRVMTSVIKKYDELNSPLLKNWLSSGEVFITGVEMLSDKNGNGGKVISSSDAQSRYQALESWVKKQWELKNKGHNDEQITNEIGERPGICGNGVVCHWVVITGVSDQWDYANQKSSNNWVRIYNPFDNQTEYYRWHDFSASRANINGQVLRVKFKRNNGTLFDR